MKLFTKILLFTLILITINVNANDTTNTNISETERLLDKYTDKAAQAINALAESLQVPAEHVYNILVKQAVVNAITWLIILIISVVLIIPVLKTVPKITDWDNVETAEGKDINSQLIIGIILGVFGVIIGIGALANIDTIITGFINPEYQAIQEILELMKK